MARSNARIVNETPTCTGICCIVDILRRSLTSPIQSGKKDATDSEVSQRLDELASKVDKLVDSLANYQGSPPLSPTVSAASSLTSVTRRQLRAAMEQTGIEVARYSQIPQFDASILDTYIPRCRRLTQLHFGHIVSNPHAPMAFQEKMGYNMTYNLVPPGNGNALHMHKSIEIFVALDGKWEIAWGMEGEHTVVLQPWDFVAVPARVCHSYKNIEEQTAQNIMTILPGKSWITWAPNVVGEARENGAECDDNGILLKYAHLTNNTKGLGSAAETVEWKHMGPDEMAPYLHRFGEKRPFTCTMNEDGSGEGDSFIEMFWKEIEPEGVFQLPRKDGVDLLLVVLDGTIILKNAAGVSVAAGSKLDAVRVPVQVLSSGDVYVSNMCPSSCHLLVTATQMRAHNELYFHLC